MALEACYMKESTLVGLRRCDPPPLLISTMQDACLAEKAALQKIAVSTASQSPAADTSANSDGAVNSGGVVDRMMIELFAELQPKIHATLVAAQSRHGC